MAFLKWYFQGVKSFLSFKWVKSRVTLIVFCVVLAVGLATVGNSYLVSLSRWWFCLTIPLMASLFAFSFWNLTIMAREVEAESKEKQNARQKP